jgi:hypothetical protein
MLGKGVMIGESDDVVSEPFESFMYFSRPVFALIEQAFYTGVGMAISPFPA